MKNQHLLELWEWAEYYCPWCYIAAVRLQKVLPEFSSQVWLRERAFPLEIYGGGLPDRQEAPLPHCLSKNSKRDNPVGWAVAV